MKLLLTLAAAAATIAVGGCGGGDSATGPADSFYVRAATDVEPNSLTRARFLARVDRICRRGWATILENFAQYSGWHKAELNRRQLYTKSVRTSFLAGLDFHLFDEIRHIGAPPAEIPEVEKVLGAMQRAVEWGQRVEATSSPAELNALFARYNRLARRYGFSEECLVNGARLARVMA